MAGKRLLYGLVLPAVAPISYAVAFVAVPAILAFAASALGAVNAAEIEGCVRASASPILFLISMLASLTALLQREASGKH